MLTHRKENPPRESILLESPPVSTMESVVASARLMTRTAVTSDGEAHHICSARYESQAKAKWDAGAIPI